MGSRDALGAGLGRGALDKALGVKYDDWIAFMRASCAGVGATLARLGGGEPVKSTASLAVRPALDAGLGWKKLCSDDLVSARFGTSTYWAPLLLVGVVPIFGRVCDAEIVFAASSYASGGGGG